MTARLIDGQAFAMAIREELRAEVAALKSLHSVTPGLATLLVGARKDSQAYVRMK